MCARRPVVSCASAVSKSLISVLKDELKYEREYYRRDEALASPPPNGFQIDNPPGKNAFYLLKEFNGEAIVVEVDLDNQQPDAGDEDEDEDGEGPNDEDDDDEIVPVKFRVSVSKGTSALIFECDSDGEYVGIAHIAHETAEDAAAGGDNDDDGTPGYTGPVFEELDDTLQQAFLDFLEERGVTAELGGYLRVMSADKTAVEYMAWLGRIKDFVALPSESEK
ncbi:hypothetical protein FOA52_000176 [Chlamydomonas sp. UWO 241]|nr:hypothetical protein FOA52_000176 [Chlamydomonas sp. UWO 241]